MIPLRHLPNLISILRIMLVPVLVVLLLTPSRSGAILAALTFFLDCWSDFIDGYLARRHGITSTLGKLLDPLADKLIVMAALVMLAAMPRTPRVPAWVVVIIVGRELAVTGLRARYPSRKSLQQARKNVRAARIAPLRLGVSSSSTSTGTSRMRRMLMRLGRWRSGIIAAAPLPDWRTPAVRAHGPRWY